MHSGRFGPGFWRECDNIRPCCSSEETTKNSDSMMRLYRSNSQNSDSGSLKRFPDSRNFQRIPEYASIRRKPQLVELEAELISLHGSERGIDVWTPPPTHIHSLPPRPPARNLPGKAARPPPPPYNPTSRFSKSLSNSAKPPPPYPGRCATPSRKGDFKPQDSSTPKSGNDSIVGEGETRHCVRSKEERAQKALSIYENVDCDQKNENTLWYEYGCV